MWQKNGKGIKYKAHYLRDARGERVLVLTGLRKDGAVDAKTAESWQMLKSAGWIRR